MADENISIGIDGNAQGIEGASSAASGAIKGTTASAADLAKAFRALQSAIDPTYAAQERYNKSLQDNRALLAAGAISAQEFAAGNRAAAASLQANIAAIEQNSAAGQAAAAQQKAIRAQEAQDARDAAAVVRQAAADKAAAEKQAAVDARAAQSAARAAEKAEALETAAVAKAAAKAASDAAKAAAADEAAAVKAAKAEERAASQAAATQAKADAKAVRDAQVIANAAAKDAANLAKQQATAERQLNESLSQFRASLDPAIAAQQRYNQTMQTATQLLMQNKLAEGEFIAIQKQATTASQVHERGLGRMNQAYINLGYQAQDVTASLASGINPLVIIAQQGGQTAAAMANYGGVVGRVAAFMAGPWGAAIIGAVTVLGFLIPKLFDSATAAERMEQSQKDLKEYIDLTTGSIKEQTTALQLRGAAQDAQKTKDALAKSVASGSSRAASLAVNATLPQQMSIGAGTGASITLPAEITNGRTANEIRILSDRLKAGSIDINGFSNALVNLSKRDPAVKQLAASVTDLLTKPSKAGAGDSYADQASQIAKATAEQKMYASGIDSLTDSEKKLIGIKTKDQQLGQSVLEAQASLLVSTDKVTQARNKLTIAEGEANLVREKAMKTSKGHDDDVAANEAYIKSVAPYIKSVEDAEAAKAAARKADAQGRRDAKTAERAAAKEREDDMQSEVAEDEYQKQAAEDSYLTQVKWQNAKIAALSAFYGADSKQVITAQRELEKMEQTHQAKLLQIADNARAEQEKRTEANLKSQEDQAKSGTDIASTNLEAQHSIGAIDGRPYIEAKRAILEQEYDLEQEYAQKIYQVQLDGMKAKQAALEAAGKQESTEYASLLEQISTLTNNFLATSSTEASAQQAKMAQANAEVAVNASQKWHTATDSIGNSLNTTFQDIWTHQHKFGSDMLSLADNLVFSYVEAGFKIAANWAATELAKTTASLFGNKARSVIATTSAATDKALTVGITGVHVANEAVKTSATVAAQIGQTGATTAGATTRSAVNLTSNTSEIVGRAATSAAGAFSSTVVIPFIGPVAAPVAAAAALAAVMGFTALLSAKGGLGDVPSDQLAMIHKKEMILPAWIAQPLRDSLRGAGPSGSMSLIGGASMAGADARAATHTNTGGSSTFNYQPTTHAPGHMGLEALLQRDGSHMRKWFNNQVRNGALSLKTTGRK